MVDPAGAQTLTVAPLVLIITKPIQYQLVMLGQALSLAILRLDLGDNPRDNAVRVEALLIAEVQRQWADLEAVSLEEVTAFLHAAVVCRRTAECAERGDIVRILTELLTAVDVMFMHALAATACRLGRSAVSRAAA